MRTLDSVENFKTSFEAILQREVLPLMAEYERERMGKIRLGIFLTIIFCIPIMLHSLIPAIIPSGCIVLIILYWILASVLYDKTAETYISVLMRLIPNFSYFKISVLKLEDIKYSRLFPKNMSMKTLTRFHFFNSYSGFFSGKHIDISKFAYSYLSKHSALNIFSGMIVRIKTDNYVKGTTCLRPRNSNYYSVTDLQDDNFQTVPTSNYLLSSQYAIYSDNIDEAKRVLNKEFVEAFDKFTKSIHSEFSYCSFCGNYIYIALTMKTFMNFFGLFTSLTKTAKYDLLYNNFASILTFVNALIEQENQEQSIENN